MVFSKNLRIVFKTISALMAGIFLWQQVSWAGASVLATTQNVTPQPTSLSPNKLQSGQAAEESVIGTKNAIEEFSALQYVPTVANTTPTFTCTYYKDGRMSSKTLNTPDAVGIIYYHYLDENWNDQGYGRIDKTRRQTALNGEMSFTYIYYIGTDRIQTKKAYSDANWSVLIATYTYCNNDSNRVESKTLSSPDAEGNIYYHYIDEEGIARYDRTRRKTSLNGEWSYSYTYYADNPFRIQTKTAYSDANWQKPVVTYTYYDDTTNRLQSRLVISSGLVTTYYNYATNLMESKILSAPDSSGNIYYHYINENWNNQGYGRIDKSKRQIPFNGEISYAYVYYTDSTGRLQARMAYSDNGWTILVATYTYYNDSTNRIEFKTLPIPDSSGNIYYHYINENWNKQGYGRIDIQKRQTQDADGVIAYKMAYYDGSSRVMSREHYSDFAMTNLVFTRTYYNDSSNRVQSLTLTTPDSQGIVYYHYINENWASQGYGRIDRAKRTNALNGELSYEFTYYKDSTGYIATKKAYSDASWSNLFATYVYYNNNNNNRIETKTLTAPDALGNIYYHYMDEAGSDPTCGRYDKTRRKTALNGELSYSYSYYSDNPFNIQTKTAYSDANWTKKVTTYTYCDDSTNRVQSKIITKTGLTITYYNDAAGRMQEQDVYSDATRTKLISSTIYYNDDTNRVESKYDPTTLTLTTYYNDNAGRIERKDVYSDSSRTTLVSSITYYNDVNGRIQFIFDPITRITTEYYNDSTGLLESKTLDSPDSSGMIYYHYINENWNNQGYGRVDKEVLASTDSNGAISYTYAYFPSSQQAQFKYCYKDPEAATLVVTYEYSSSGELINTVFADNSVYTYYTDGRMESKTLLSPDSDGMIYYHYIDENWNGQGYGRVDESKALVPLNGQLIYSTGGGGILPCSVSSLSSAVSSDDTTGSLQYIGELSYTYTYYDDADGRLQTKNAYSDADWTNLVAIYNYYNDSTNRVMSKIDVSTGIIYTYYNNPSGCMESKTLPSPDSYGNIYYHYMNENWNGRGYGRIDKSLMQDPSSDGTIAYSYSYYNNEAGRLKTKNSYSDDNWTILVSSCNYSNDPENKIMPNIGYTYYSSGRIESETFSIPDSYGNIYYHYIDEDWNGKGYGRIDRSVRQAPLNGELSYSYSYYNDGSGRIQEINAYSSDNFINLVSVYTYYDNPTNNIRSIIYGSGKSYTYYISGRPESESFVVPDYYGNIYYHYIDENWANMGHGRTDTFARGAPGHIQDYAFDILILHHPTEAPEEKYLYFNEFSYSFTYNDDPSYNVWLNTGMYNQLHVETISGYSDSNSTQLLWTFWLNYNNGPSYGASEQKLSTFSYGDFCWYIQPQGGDEQVICIGWDPLPIPDYYGGYTILPGYFCLMYNLGATYAATVSNELQQQISAINTSNESFSSPPDTQQQQVSVLNQRSSFLNGDPIDLSTCRSYYEFEGALQDMYGANPNQLKTLSDSINNLSMFLSNNNPLISINSDISGGATLTGTTSDGARIEISSFSGEPFFGDINTPPWLGVYNGSNGYVQGDISVKNGTTVEASLTTITGPTEFNRQIVNSNLIQSRNDVGSYTNVSTATFESTNYTFTGEGAGGFYFGFSCDSIYSLTQLKTNSESLVYLPTDVMEGQRAPVTDTEIYGKLLYDIYYTGKQPLTLIEATLIQTKTQEIVQDALQNVAGVTQNDINAIATAQSTNIIDIAEGITAYNPPN